MEAAREGPSVVLLVSCLNCGDAVGNEVAAMGEILRRNRYASEIWTGWRHSRWDALPVRVISHLPPLGRDDLLIYHFASQCPFAGEIASLPCRVLLRYHNVTPSTYFHGYDAAAESATANALRQLPEILPAVILGKLAGGICGSGGMGGRWRCCPCCCAGRITPARRTRRGCGATGTG